MKCEGLKTSTLLSRLAIVEKGRGANHFKSSHALNLTCPATLDSYISVGAALIEAPQIATIMAAEIQLVVFIRIFSVVILDLLRPV